MSANNVAEAKKTVEACVSAIDSFDAECQAEEYTDTDAAWNLLNQMRDDLKKAGQLLG